MTEPADDPTTDAPDNLVAMIVEQAAEIADLDGPRAEAWASDVLALLAETDPGDAPVDAVLGALESPMDPTGAAAAIRVIAGRSALDSPGDGPEWLDHLDTSRCEGAWLLDAGGASSAAFRFVDRAEVRHVITVDLVPGPPETVGEVAVGPGDLLDALDEDDAGIETADASPETVASRVVAALCATDAASESLVVNGRLLLRRLDGIIDVDLAPPVLPSDDVPAPPERDPDDDAYALDVLERALGAPEPIADAAGAEIDAALVPWLVASGCDDAVPVAVAAVVGAVAPVDLGPLAPSERDAVLSLEWADWLGAVIGVVRAGAGTLVDGATLVDFVNRCPEVTTTIPKGDRPRIEWAFDTVIRPWSAAGLLDADTRLTDLATAALPHALRESWS